MPPDTTSVQLQPSSATVVVTTEGKDLLKLMSGTGYTGYTDAWLDLINSLRRDVLNAPVLKSLQERVQEVALREEQRVLDGEDGAGGGQRSQ